MTAATDARAAAFEFGRRLGDPAFRKSLPRNLRKTQNVLVVVDTDTVQTVLERALFQTRPPVLVAVLRRDNQFEFLKLRIPMRALFASIVRRSTPAQVPPVLAETTIGALCDDLSRSRRHTESNEWVKVTHFAPRAIHAH